ncbi:MAG: tRNA (guanosine(46)-N7)-methyltransferase TrmB [Candidatus Mycalebacterium zealandia]|nr:MAG: tRNA (guanosine(46)-N7)-methyltransferase TrmB [Candidatus Mycalebacterium zealandia]
MSPRSAAFDVSEHLPPISKQTIFGDSKPATLDIGCGDGEFLLELARLMPDFNHVGVEIKTGRFVKAVKNAEKSGTQNLKYIHLDGLLATGLFASATFDRVYMNFPDPWPKDRHRKHRIVNADFASVLARVIIGGGRFEIASDHDEYIERCSEVFARSEMFRSISGGEALLSYPGGRPQTRFEKMFREKGVDIKYLIYEAAGSY